MEISVLTISILVGAGLGSRFRVLVLLPAIAISLVVIATIDRVHGVGSWSIVEQTVLAVVALQVGYLVGAAATRLPASTGSWELRQQ
jgi:hypothetical protein